MPLTLRIHFGGLCMLWQSAPNRQMFVLMPTVRHGGTEDEDDHFHCQMMVCDKKYVDGPNPPPKTLVDKLKKDTDLSGIASPGGVKSMKGFAAIGHYANQTGTQIPVASDLLDLTKAPPFYVGARIVLPLPSKEFVLANDAMASFRVPNTTGVASLHGLAQIDYDVGNISYLQKFSRRLKPVNDVIEIGLLNVRVRDLNEGKRYRHYEGEPWTHQQAYYHLLEGWGDELREGPPAIVAATSGFEREKPAGAGNSCNNADPLVWPPQGNRFVDPYTCTLGGGCEPQGAC